MRPSSARRNSTKLFSVWSQPRSAEIFGARVTLGVEVASWSLPSSIQLKCDPPQAMLDKLKYYGTLMKPYENETPKIHLMLHGMMRSVFLGNPWAYSCWADEIENRTLKVVLRNVSQQAFESLGLQKLERVLARGCKRAASKMT